MSSHPVLRKPVSHSSNDHRWSEAVGWIRDWILHVLFSWNLFDLKASKTEKRPSCSSSRSIETHMRRSPGLWDDLVMAMCFRSVAPQAGPLWVEKPSWVPLVSGQPRHWMLKMRWIYLESFRYILDQNKWNLSTYIHFYILPMKVAWQIQWENCPTAQPVFWRSGRCNCPVPVRGLSSSPMGRVADQLLLRAFPILVQLLPHDLLGDLKHDICSIHPPWTCELLQTGPHDHDVVSCALFQHRTWWNLGSFFSVISTLSNHFSLHPHDNWRTHMKVNKNPTKKTIEDKLTWYNLLKSN